MPVTYRFSCENVSTRELEELFEAADLDGRVGDKIRRAFLSSSPICLAYDEDRLVGASRAITDGEYHGLIYDVAVHPDYQRQGVGRHMMEELLSRMPVWRVMLVADDGVQEFYRRLGFESYPDAMVRLDWARLRDAVPKE
jgi:ribosomal protein S18 acetylase RimI-like enzyme